MRKALICSLAFLLCSSSLFGYTLEGESWTLNRTVQIQLTFGGPHPLIDGFGSFNESAANALTVWNSHLKHLTFVPVIQSPVVPSSSDDENSATFSTTVFGDSFGPDVLAVTLISNRDGVTEESDTLFNLAFTWDSYTGPLRPGIQDLHRVALHEFGHTIGLDHPDQHGQHVDAIMNSIVSDRSALSADDIAGAEKLYGNGPAVQSAVPAPVLANIATRGIVGGADNVLIGGFVVQGSEPATVILRAIGYSLSALNVGTPLPDPVITVYDEQQRPIAMNDDWISSPDAETIASYHLDPPNSIESALLLTLQPGTYTAVIESFANASQPAATGVGLFELYDLHTTGGRAGNISTRGQVLTGDNVLIGGFIVGGTEAKPIAVRALGPSLAARGVSGSLSNPMVELHDGNGALLASNDDWAKDPSAAEIKAVGLAPTNPKEAALSATLNPGSYTAIVSGVNGATGVGLIEIYDLTPVPTP